MSIIKKITSYFSTMFMSHRGDLFEYTKPNIMFNLVDEKQNDNFALNICVN